MQTAILGGGLTGVTLARLLHARGEECVVLEAEEEIGGLCRSFTAEGYTFDRGGSHIIFSRDPEVLDFMRDVLKGNRGERDRETKIFYKHRFITYPFENGLSDLPKEDLFFCINEYIRTLIASEKGELKQPRNLKEWCTATFGRGIAESYLIPYNEKIWKYPSDRISCHWVEGRIPRPPVEDVIKSAIGIETQGYAHQARFSYPVRGGIEALIQAIAFPVKDSIRTGFCVRSIRKQGDRWLIGDGKRSIEADRIFSTIPLQHLFAAMDPVPANVRNAVGGLMYNSLACIFIGLQGTVPGISWLYIPDPADGLENRISFPSNYSSEVVPHGNSSILVEITYRPGDEVSSMSDRALVDHAVASLSGMGIIRPENVEYTGIERQKFAYVIYDLDYLDNIAVVRKYCAAIGIDLIGRFSQFEYLNMDGCIRSALDFAGRLPCA